MNEELAIVITDEIMNRINLWAIKFVQNTEQVSMERAIDIIKDRLIRATNKHISADDWLDFSAVENPEAYSDEINDIFLRKSKEGYEAGYKDAALDILEVLMGVA